MVAKDTSYGSETYRPYLDIERIINVQSACSVNRGHDLNVNKRLSIISSSGNNDTIVQPERTGLYCFCGFHINANYVRISGFTVKGRANTDYSSGIQLTETQHSFISNNKIVNFDRGIRLVRQSNNNIIRNNNFSENKKGIWLENVNNNILTNNNISNNSLGIQIYADSPDNVLTENTIYDNLRGIYMENTGGTINNRIYHNNFKNIKYNVINGPSGPNPNTPNYWDNGHPSGGNYWNDYIGSDLNGDGIGDTPYNITPWSDVIQDRYPLMNPWTAIPLSGKIAFASSRDGNQEVYVMNANGTDDPIDLTNRPDADDGDPTWSPDGKQIAFSSNRSGNWTTYIMNADDGSDQVCLLEDVHDAWGPAWSPDGKKIAVAIT